MNCTFESQIAKLKNKIYLTSLFVASGLILLPSEELFRMVISCKIVNSSMKFKFIHKISIIQEMFLVFFNLLRRPDITHLGRMRASGCASLSEIIHRVILFFVVAEICPSVRKSSTSWVPKSWPVAWSCQWHGWSSVYGCRWVRQNLNILVIM